MVTGPHFNWYEMNLTPLHVILMQFIRMWFWHPCLESYQEILVVQFSRTRSIRWYRSVHQGNQCCFVSFVLFFHLISSCVRTYCIISSKDWIWIITSVGLCLFWALMSGDLKKLLHPLLSLTLLVKIIIREVLNSKFWESISIFCCTWPCKKNSSLCLFQG